jgi:urocanate hydratase
VARSVERALALLELAVVAPEGIALSDAARACGQPASTALRHLRALERAGLVDRRSDATFVAGAGFLRLAARALDAAPLTRLAGPILRELAAATEETCYLAVVAGTHAVYVAQAEGPRALRHVGWLGRRVPLAGTAVGIALRGEVAVGRAVARAAAVEPDVTAVSAPVRAGGEAPVAAVSVIGPTARLKGRRRAVGAAAVAAADRLAELAEVVRRAV